MISYRVLFLMVQHGLTFVDGYSSILQVQCVAHECVCVECGRQNAPNLILSNLLNRQPQVLCSQNN